MAVIMDDADGIPWVDRRPVGMFEWIDLVGRVRMSGLGVAAKTVKAVAWRMAVFGDPDGSRVKPGIAKLAVLCEADYKTVKKVIAALESNGFLGRVARGSGPRGARQHHANVYQLTIPLDIVERFILLSPDDLEDEARKIREANRRVTGKSAPRNPKQLQGQNHPVTDASGQEVTGKSGVHEQELRGNPEHSYGEIPSAIPTSDLPPVVTDPSSGDLRLNGAVDGSTGDQRRFSINACGNPRCHGGLVRAGIKFHECQDCKANQEGAIT